MGRGPVHPCGDGVRSLLCVLSRYACCVNKTASFSPPPPPSLCSGKNLAYDPWRQMQVYKHTANPQNFFHSAFLPPHTFLQARTLRLTLGARCSCTSTPPTPNTPGPGSLQGAGRRCWRGPGTRGWTHARCGQGGGEGVGEVRRRWEMGGLC